MKTMKVEFGAYVERLPGCPEGVDVRITANVSPPSRGTYYDPPDPQETEILSAMVETKGKWFGQDLLMLANWEEWLEMEQMDMLAWEAYEEVMEREYAQGEHDREVAAECAREILVG